MNSREAFNEICKLAKEHALIWQAAGGVVIIVDQQTQKEEGIYDDVQFIHNLGKEND
jgi:hypothetical protein